MIKMAAGAEVITIIEMIIVDVTMATVTLETEKVVNKEPGANEVVNVEIEVTAETVTRKAMATRVILTTRVAEIRKIRTMKMTITSVIIRMTIINRKNNRRMIIKTVTVNRMEEGKTEITVKGRIKMIIRDGDNYKLVNRKL